jgi:hypothetical protein
MIGRPLRSNYHFPGRYNYYHPHLLVLLLLLYDYIYL